MKKFYDTVIDQATGQPRQGATVTVTDGTGAAVQLYSDNGVTPIENPINQAVTDVNGLFQFYVANGTYTLTIQYAGATPVKLTGIQIYEEVKVIDALGTSTTDAPSQNAVNNAVNSIVVDSLGTSSTNAPSQKALAISTAAAGIGAADGNTVQDNLNHGGYFEQAGTGAIQRTSQDNARDTISVKQFGAVGDGVTDDSPAIQAAIDYLIDRGGRINFPKAQYFLGSQVVIDRTNNGGVVLGAGNLILSGHGATILSSGAFFPFLLRGGWAPYSVATIEGLVIDHSSATVPTGGIDAQGAAAAIIRDVVFAVNGGLPAGYAAIRIGNTDPTDPNTGSYWSTIERCSIRPYSGADGNCDYGVLLLGAANNTRIRGCRFNGSNKHVSIQSYSGQTYLSNAVLIDGNAFEGPTTSTAIEVIPDAAATVHISGLRVTNNRFESLSTLLSLIGTATTVQIPTYLSGNYVSPGSVTTYLNNPNNLSVNSLDVAISTTTDLPPVTIYNRKGVSVRANDASYDPLSIYAANVGKGIRLFRGGTNVELGSWSFRATLGSTLTGTAGQPLYIARVGGLSSSATGANNLNGTATLASGTKAVTFTTAEPDASYDIFISSRANETYWVTNQSSSGFTINSSNASSTAAVGWLLVRR